MTYNKLKNIPIKKVSLIIALIGINFGIKGQVQHVDGETLLTNPLGRTLMIEKDNNDSWLTFHDSGHYWYSMGIDISNSGVFSLNPLNYV